jgi:ectoine hydroxylase-related dioxygenase (phytanoyl-CoA dioxygenase family)
MSRGQFHHSPPPFAPYVHAEVIANPIATSVCEAAISSPVQLTFLSGNTNMPGSEAQALHRDAGNLWPELVMSHPPSMLSAHIPLTDMTAANGSTEIWPGTHNLAHLAGPASYGFPEGLDERTMSPSALVHPPIQPDCPVGSILLRDARAWHRAMPNASDRPRIMLGLVYGAIWRRAGRIPMMESARDALRAVRIPLNVRYTNEPFDYLEDWRERTAREARSAPAQT